MTKKVSKLLTTEEVNEMVNVLKSEKRANFSIKETDETVTVTLHDQQVFNSISKGNGAWITRFNEDLFITTDDNAK